MRYLCKNYREIQRVFQISQPEAMNISTGRPAMVTAQQLDIIRSVCSNELTYAFVTRVAALMQNDRYRAAFVAWVNTAAALLDSFRSMQTLAGSSPFVAQEDPFLSPLYHLSSSMDEVAALLQQLHQKCPQFDGLFFRGTRFLDGDQTTPMPSVNRVPSSVEVVSLSPEDERLYQQFKEQQ